MHERRKPPDNSERCPQRAVAAFGFHMSGDAGAVNDGAARLLRHQDGVATIAQLVGQGHDPRKRGAGRGRRRGGGSGWARHCVVSPQPVPTAESADVGRRCSTPSVRRRSQVSPRWRRVGFTFFGAEMQQIHVVVHRGRATTGCRASRSTSRAASEPDCRPRRRHASPARAGPPGRGSLAALSALRVRQCSRPPCSNGCALLRSSSNELRFVGRIRHKAHMRLAIARHPGGAEALSEIDIARNVPSHRPRATGPTAVPT